MFQPGKSLAQIEKELILEALQFFNGNQTKTAESLGLSTKTIQNKLKQYLTKEETLEGSKTN